MKREVRRLADALYRRVDWQWARNGHATVSHGWKPETGFLRYRWQGYNEALILYVLGLGSPTYPLPEKSYRAWTSTYRWKRLYGQNFSTAPRCSCISSLTCGSTSAASRMRSCGGRRVTTSRTAVPPLT